MKTVYQLLQIADIRLGSVHSLCERLEETNSIDVQHHVVMDVLHQSIEAAYYALRHAATAIEAQPHGTEIFKREMADIYYKLYQLGEDYNDYLPETIKLQFSYKKHSYLQKAIASPDKSRKVYVVKKNSLEDTELTAELCREYGWSC